MIEFARVARSLLLCGIGGVMAACTDERPAAPPREPNHLDVLLCVIDTLRADRLGCYGADRPTSPTVDRLAGEGVRVVDCCAQSSWTGPSMVSMFTSRRLSADFVHMPDTETLTRRLRRRGYATLAAQYNSLLAPGNGYDRDFDQYLTFPPPKKIGAALAKVGDKPLFFYLHLADPHDPYEPTKPHDRFAPRPLEPERAARVEQFVRASMAGAAKADQDAAVRKTLDAMAAERGRYDGDVHQADGRLAAVLEMLRRSGRLERTIVVIAADHGETLFEHEETPSALSDTEAVDAMQRFKRGHNAVLTEVLLRVPLIFHGPGVPRGLVHPGPTENIDIVPTVLELLGIDPDGHLDGTSLVGDFAMLANGEVPTGREFVFANTKLLTSVRHRSGAKLVRPWSHDVPERPQFFDLTTDPFELRPLGIDDERAERLTEAIKRMRSAALRPTNAEDTIDPLVFERMRELGYIGDEER
ncbi:MAG: sulfatase [Planctomycetes bacterium]|nr:sulfatase [Planctomycetota bacterium]